MNKLIVGGSAALLILIVLIIVIIIVVVSKPSFTIDESNNVFTYYWKNTSKKSVIVPSGKYSPDELASKLTELLKAHHPNWSVVWDSKGKKFLFSNPAFLWDRCPHGASIAPLLKLSSDNEKCGIAWKNSEESASF